MLVRLVDLITPIVVAPIYIGAASLFKEPEHRDIDGLLSDIGPLTSESMALCVNDEHDEHHDDECEFRQSNADKHGTPEGCGVSAP
jgi:hypothetical protein